MCIEVLQSLGLGSGSDPVFPPSYRCEIVIYVRFSVVRDWRSNFIIKWSWNFGESRLGGQASFSETNPTLLFWSQVYSFYFLHGHPSPHTAFMHFELATQPALDTRVEFIKGFLVKYLLRICAWIVNISPLRSLPLCVRTWSVGTKWPTSSKRLNP